MWVGYTTDFYHSYGSRDLITVCHNKATAIGRCREHARSNGPDFDEDDGFNLHNINQTQGYDGEHEYVIEEIGLNKVL